MPGRHPAIRRFGLVRKRGIERCFEPVRVYLFGSEILDEIIDRREHDFRRECQRRNRRPRSDRTVVGSVRNSTSDVIVKFPLTASHYECCWPGPVTGGDSPAAFAVVVELARISNRVLALDISRATAVLEIIDASVAHEQICDASEVHPHV